MTDGAETVKVSSVARGVSLSKLEERFGVMYGEYREAGERELAREPAGAAEAGRRATGGPGLGRDGGEANRPESLSEVSDGMIRALEEPAQRSGKRLGEIAESARLSSQQASAATTHLAELQQSMAEVERNLTYLVERLKR